MSKSKKNTIDPEKIINNYGADSVRLFILSDSPPEKDVQWSDEGIISSFKFIQKLWNLNKSLSEEIAKKHPKNSNDEIDRYTNKFIKKITHNLENFNYNIVIANLHELYSFLSKAIKQEYTKETLTINYKKILISMIPIIPHFSNECLKMLKIDEKIDWPNYDEKFLEEKTLQIVVQINGKKRELINTERGNSELTLLREIKKNLKLQKYLENKEIKKTIFIPNKLINIIV
jgi:leucyl-tRNA synthetase